MKTNEFNGKKNNADIGVKYTFLMPDRSEEMLFYSCDDEEIQAARIGHLRIDFGSGEEFHSTWWDTTPEMNDSGFKKDLGAVVNSLRNNLLSDREFMAALLRTMDSLDLGGRGKGLKVQTDRNVFYLRCLPQAGEYDCYCYCYDREMLEQAMSQNEMMDEEIELGGMTQ